MPGFYFLVPAKYRYSTLLASHTFAVLILFSTDKYKLVQV